jgi:heme-degrading monooxygenase HmoA
MTARFVLEVHLKAGREDDLLAAYSALRSRLEQGVDGLISHQLCQSVDDADTWIITSEWDSLEASSHWDRSEEHDALVRPLRECWDRAADARRAGHVRP